MRRCLLTNQRRKSPRTIFNSNFTNGIGNNIFQYMFGYLVCKSNDYDFSHDDLTCLGVPSKFIERLKNDKKYIRFELYGEHGVELKRLINQKFSKRMYLDFNGYPEDYTIYTPHRDELRTLFPSPKVTNTKDLVVHLRAGDRLLMSGCYKNGGPIPIEEYKQGLNSFEFDKLHIVTDMPIWEPMNFKKLSKLKFHRVVMEKDRIDLNIAVNYWNELYKFLETYNPIVRAGFQVDEDFNYLRIFDQIMFAHGTLAWWAAFLSNSSKVGLYGRWRGGKNINLGWTDLPGWFQWGRKTAPSRSIKERNLIDCAEEGGHRIFVETGTRGATTLVNINEHFHKMYSVELLQDCYEACLKKVLNAKIDDKTRLYQGDSAEKLKDILPEIKEPALFWLDAHAGKDATPIMAELDLVLQTNLRHTIVIDDSRYFGTQEAYPTIDEVKVKVKEYQPNARIDIKFDSIRIFL